MSEVDQLFRESLVLRIAFGDLVGRVCLPGTRADDVPLDEVLASLDGEFGLDRAAALLYANQVADSVEEGQEIAAELRAWLVAGRRPRTVAQVLRDEAPAREHVAALRREQGRTWWQRLKRALIADEEESRRYDEREIALRLREGKQP